ncbi:MAG TPA: response regulator transcription factor [Vicinamibacterales bacterium]|nr:response regulator transcription factor [Vicinamibacterales bacterium]
MGNTNTPTRIAILSDDRLYIDGLLHILRDDPDLIPISVSGGPPLAISLRASDASLAVVDGRAPASLDLCSMLIADVRLPVILVSVADDESAISALMMGARGIVYRTEAPDRIPRAIRLVSRGGVWAPRKVLVAVLEQLKVDTRARTSAESPLADRLSSREREVFRHAAAGLGNKEVADRLSISEATVKVHLTHIFQKLGLRGRGELAAAYHGIIR